MKKIYHLNVNNDSLFWSDPSLPAVELVIGYLRDIEESSISYSAKYLTLFIYATSSRMKFNLQQSVSRSHYSPLT